MRLRIALLVFLVAAVLPLIGGTFSNDVSVSSAVAQSRSVTPDGRILEGPAIPSGELHLIVQFRDTPLFDRSRSSILSSSQSRASALHGFDARFAQFARI